MRTIFTRECFIGGYKLLKKENDVEVYIKLDNELVIMGFRSKKQVKPAFNYRYRSISERDEKVNNFIANMQTREAEKKAKRAARKTFKHDFKIGDIFCSSWGYDQTNVDFMQVVAITNKTVTIKEIAEKSVNKEGYSCMSDFRMPVKDSFVDGCITPKDKTITLVINEYGSFSADSVRYFSKWDGKEKYNSWYA